jgi:hypothetical protein
MRFVFEISGIPVTLPEQEVKTIFVFAHPRSGRFSRTRESIIVHKRGHDISAQASPDLRLEIEFHQQVTSDICCSMASTKDKKLAIDDLLCRIGEYMGRVRPHPSDAERLVLSG